jgi:hypothetical protein
MAHVVICEHIKENGDTCGSPALRDHVFCYFHQRLRNPRHRPGDFEYRLPTLDTPHAILIATEHIAQGALDGTIEERRARMLFSALRLAMSALDKINKTPEYLMPTTEASRNDGLDNVGTGFQARPVLAHPEPPVAIRKPSPAPTEAPAKKLPLSATKTKLLKKIIRRGPKDPRFATAARLLDHTIAGAS